MDREGAIEVKIPLGVEVRLRGTKNKHAVAAKMYPILSANGRRFGLVGHTEDGEEVDILNLDRWLAIPILMAWRKIGAIPRFEDLAKLYEQEPPCGSDDQC